MPKVPTKQYVQDPPFCIQIEMTESCNLRCSFCGLNGIRGKENNYKFMTTELADRLALQIKNAGWNARLEFAMHGEPSMNPQFVTILKQFREILGPKIHMMMTTNGAGFMRDTTVVVDNALRYLNVLAMDWYEGVKIVPKILENYSGNHTPLRYPQDPKVNPHHRRKPSQHDWVIIQDIVTADKGVHATLNNHAGAGAPKNDNAQGKRCAKPFRELSIRWDGNIAICCNTWEGSYKCGNITESSIEEIWQNKFFEAARRKLILGERDFKPCEGCDALSYRTGLLPDKFGKEKLPLPDSSTTAAIEEAVAGKPYTPVVLRPWESPNNSR